MKTLFLLPVLAILFASCSKTDTTSDPVADLALQKTIVAQSDWTITQYTDSGIDETSDYSGYKFKFTPDGVLVAVAPDTTFSGAWTMGTGSAKSDDNPSADDKLNKLTISITGSKLMDHLSHKWLIDNITATEILLRDYNLASNEILRFGK